MEKINLDLQANRQARQDLIKQLKQDCDVLDMLKQLSVDVNVIDDNVVSVLNWLKQYKSCKLCKGLNTCTSAVKGHQLTLDKNLESTFAYCRYANQHNDRFKHKENYLLCDLTEQALENDIDAIDLTNEDEQYCKCVDLIKEWLQLLPNKGLYLYGNLGVGKSYLASCITNYLAKNDYKVAFVNFPKLAYELRNNLAVKDYVKNYVNKMKYAKCLVIDDIGAENISAYIRDDILFTVLDYRMENKKWTIFTSNSDFDNLTRRLMVASGEVDNTKALRIIERIKTMSVPMAMAGKSRRF